jgi:DNA-binding HxlR family transcriptional regulator
MGCCDALFKSILVRRVRAGDTGLLPRVLPRPPLLPLNVGVPLDRKVINREILLGLWKIHILHHAAEGGVVGNWMLEELCHHGYEVSPGTLYPILARMERLGWLRGDQPAGRGNRQRRTLHITAEGRRVLALVMRQVGELRRELPVQPRRKG